MLNYETQLTRSNRKHTQAPVAATIRSISDFGVQLTASWNELYLSDSPVGEIQLVMWRKLLLHQPMLFLPMTPSQV